MQEIVLTEQNFDSEVLSSALPVLVDFWAPWCAPCRMLAPTIEKIAEKYDGKVKVGKVNVDDASSIAVRFGIASIPTVLLFQNGAPTKSSVGFVPMEQLEQLLADI